MSVPRTVMQKCHVCQKTSEQTVLLSSNQFGSPDLDLRPAEMMRSTMCWWIQECPTCGYVSESIEDKTVLDVEFLRSADYRECPFTNRLANRYYRQYLILKETGADADAIFRAVLRAAWALDDSFDGEGARRCREWAITALHRVIRCKGENDDRHLRMMDLYRRSGQFERLIEEYGDRRFSNERYQRIHDFQLERAMAKDAACYRISDATED